MRKKGRKHIYFVRVILIAAFAIVNAILGAMLFVLAYEYLHPTAPPIALLEKTVEETLDEDARKAFEKIYQPAILDKVVKISEGEYWMSLKKPQGQGDGKGNRPDPNELDRDKRGETAGKTQGGAEEKVGKSKASEEIPQGGPPAERFYAPGEKGREGIKGARYVTVQMPEEIAADSKGVSTGAPESKGRKASQKMPVSNMPLPAHMPDAPAEKQQMPLQYRGIIR